METFSALLAICAGNSPAPVNSPHKGQWRGALMFSLICAWINGWVNNREAGDMRRYRAHYDVIVMRYHPTPHNGCDYLSILGLKMKPVSKRGPWCFHRYQWLCLWLFTCAVTEHELSFLSSMFGLYAAFLIGVLYDSVSNRNETWHLDFRTK